ncbi:MAG: peroxide stress protein YaaA [Capnocytophaga sp.]|nr:peroxide stress protein YaaA [Capnocytophaga sp.]
MKIVISPAKSLDFESSIPTTDFSLPVFEKQIGKIHSELKSKSPQQLSELMHISEKLADLNWQRNQDFSMPFTPKNARQAIYSFTGDVYQGLDVRTLAPDKIEKMQHSLRILSGLYGLLRPLDLIQPYRLEMGTKMPVGPKKDLYDFWQKHITDALNSQLSDGELFVNLASNEYFKAVDTSKLKVPVITPIFKDWKNDHLKIISFYAKKARGLMVRYILQNTIQTIDDLKGFDYEGYAFSESESLKNNELVFVR